MCNQSLPGGWLMLRCTWDGHVLTLTPELASHFLVLQEIAGETILSCELQAYFKNTSWKSIWLCEKL